MNTFVMMVGLPGSGKSYYAEKIKSIGNNIIHSSDDLRKELFKNENDNSRNPELFQELHKRIKNDLKSNKFDIVIYDATNINRKRRVAFLNEIKNIKCKKICFIVNTPYYECLKNNSLRNRIVPEEVIRKMRMGFQIPALFEGWDKIEYANKWNKTTNTFEYILASKYFDQQNSHHKYTLGIHLVRTFNSVKKLLKNDIYHHGYNELIIAARLHDVGKLYTQSFVNSKGEKTKEAHYYGHENVGCYESMFFKYEDCNIDSNYISLLINLHMIPYNWEKDNNTKLKEKYRRLWGNTLFNDVMLLHNADINSHSNLSN